MKKPIKIKNDRIAGGSDVKAIIASAFVLFLGVPFGWAQTLYYDRASFLSDSNVTTTSSVNFDSLSTGTDLNNQTLSGVTFSAPGSSPLAVILGSVGVRYPMSPSTGLNVLSPGGSDPSLQDDDLSVVFNNPVQAAGMDVVFDVPDGASYVGVTFYDASNNIIAQNNFIPCPNGAPGYQFIGLAANSPMIKQIVFSEFDGSPPDDNVAYDSLIFSSNPANAICTISGHVGMAGIVDGIGTNAQFNTPHDVAVDAAGDVFLADEVNHTIRELTLAGTNWVSATIAGRVGAAGSADGAGTNAQFNYPSGVAVDGNGNVFVADEGNHTIRELTKVGLSWQAATIAGLAGNAGSADGSNGAARFNSPSGLAVDASDDVYVADWGNHTIRELIPSGTNWNVRTIAGLAGDKGTANGANSAARFNHPEDVAVDANNDVYVADWGNHAIREMTLAGTNWNVSTIAGVAGSTNYGSADGVGGAARFYYPSGLALDSAGNIYVADTFNDTIREMTLAGGNWTVSTIAGAAGVAGSADGVGVNSRFYNPCGVAVDSSNNVFVADTGNQTVRGPRPIIISGPQSQFTSAGSTVVFNVAAAGPPPLSYQWQKNGTNLVDGGNISGSTTSNLTLSAVGTNDIASYAVVVSDHYGSAASGAANLTMLLPGAHVGYYTDGNPSDTGPVAPFQRVGLVPLQITDISTFDLSSINILFIDEPANAPLTSILQNRMGDIQSWVRAGGCLIVHDRSIGLSGSPDPFLLGLPAADSERDETSDVDVVPPGNTLVTAGPYGILNNGSLDGGNLSAHGYVLQSTLPAGTKPILCVGGNTNELVDFTYPLGGGLEYYSSIPIDYYLDGNGGGSFQVNATTIYMPNLMAYILSLTGQLVTAPPTIATQPQSQTVTNGNQVSFAVTALGSPPLVFQWRKNGTNLTDGGNISGSTTNTLNLSAATTNDTGNYTVLITNAYGSLTSSVAALTVVVSPVSGTGNLIINGDFENEPNWSGGVSYDGSETALIGSELPGWTIETNHAVTIHIAPGPYLTISGNYTANTDGEGYNGHNANFYQDFASQSGASYALEFNWQSWGYVSTPTTSKLEISITDTNSGAILFDGRYSYDGNGQPHPVHDVLTNFVGTGNPLRLRIQETPESGYNDNTFMVDNFSVTAGPGVAVPPTPGLISWWRAESNALDSVGTNNGTLQAGVTYTNGEVGQAFSFSGVNAYVSLDNGTANLPLGNSPRTIEAWVQTTMSGLGEIVSYGAPSAGNDFTFGIFGNSIFVSSWISPQYTVSASVNDGAFHHVAVTYDGTNASVYCDGVLLDNRAFAINTGSGTANIGARISPTEFFNGAIDEVGIYSRALSSNEVAAIYTAGSAGKVSNKPYFLTAANLPNGAVGVLYSQTITASVTTGNTFFLTGGSLPAGLNLSTNGLISGTPANAGTNSFTILATSGLGQTNSQAFVLAVFAPPVISAQPPGEIVTNGSPAFLAVGVSGSAPLFYQWQKNGINLTDGGNISGSSTNALSLNAATTNDAGNYSVIITNVGGSVTSSVVTLSVVSSATNQFNVLLPLTAGTGNKLDLGLFAGGTVLQLSFVGHGDLVNSSYQTFPDGSLFAPAGSPYGYGNPGSTNYPTLAGGDGVNHYPGGGAVYDAGGGSGFAFAGKATTDTTDPAGIRDGSVVGTFNPSPANTNWFYIGYGGTFTVPSGGGHLYLAVNDSTSASGDNHGTYYGILVATAAVSATNLVAHWTFDETNGVIAHDSTGSFNGTNSGGATFVTGGISGGAISLSSLSNSVVNMGTNFPGFTTGDFSIVAWIRTPTTTANTAILGKHAAGIEDGYILELNQGGATVGDYGFAGRPYFYTSDSPHNEVDATNTVNDGAWHQIFVVQAAGVSRKIYVDGVLNGTGAAETIVGNTAPFLIGGVAISGAPTGLYDGLVDDVQVYNQALNQGEVTQLYNHPGLDLVGISITSQPQSLTVTNGNSAGFTVTASSISQLFYQWQKNGTNLTDGGSVSGSTTSALNLGATTLADAGNYAVIITNAYDSVTSSVAVLSISSIPVPAPSGLVAWWRAESNALDSAGINNGALVGGATFGPGKVGTAFSFGGTRDYVSVPSSPDVQQQNGLTLEAWVFVQGAPAFESGIAGTWDDLTGANRTYLFWLLNGELEFLISHDGSGYTRVTDSTQLPTNTWVHVAATYDGTNMVIYRNGVQVGLTAYPGIIATNNKPFFIGRTDGGGSSSEYWKGLIDEVSIYDHALTSNEIAAIYLADTSGKTESPPQTNAVGEFLFADTFNTGAVLWSNVRGNWVVSNGVYFAQAPGNTPFTFTTLPFPLTNFAIDVDISQVGDGGIWLRSDAGGSNGVVLITGGNGWGNGNTGGGRSLYWHVVNNGTVSSKMNEALNVITNPGVQNIHLRVEVVSNLYSVYVNGSPTPATTLTDTNFASGLVGLYDFSSQTFDNVVVQNIPIPPSLAIAGAAARQATLSWPASYSAYVLENSANLGSVAAWNTVTNSVTYTNGIFTLPLGVTNASGFFRLRVTQ